MKRIKQLQRFALNALVFYERLKKKRSEGCLLSKGKIMRKKLLLLSLMISTFTACTPESQRNLSHALHDANVQLQRDAIRQKCRSGYYANNYSYWKHRQQCGYDYIAPPIPLKTMHINGGLR